MGFGLGTVVVGFGLGTVLVGFGFGFGAVVDDFGTVVDAFGRVDVGPLDGEVGLGALVGPDLLVGVNRRNSVVGVKGRYGPSRGGLAVEIDNSGFSRVPTSRSPGSGKAPWSVFAVTACMNLRHISVGSVPPCTLMPCTSSIDRLPSG